MRKRTAQSEPTVRERLSQMSQLLKPDRFPYTVLRSEQNKNSKTEMGLKLLKMVSFLKEAGPLHE